MIRLFPRGLLQKNLAWAALFLLCGFLWTGALPVLQAKTIDCVPDQGCPCDPVEGCKKRIKTAECCQPPPCEVYEQIRIKKALRRLYSDKKVNKRLMKQAGGDNSAAAKLLDDWVKEKAKTMGNQLRCKWEAPYAYPGGYETKSWCEIFVDLPGDNDEKRTQAEAHRKTDSCAEFIDAIWAHEGHHLEQCNTTNSTERANEPLSVFAKEEKEGYKREIDSLKDSLKQYWYVCSIVADAETKRQIADAGISVLKKKAPKKAPGKQRPGK